MSAIYIMGQSPFTPTNEQLQELINSKQDDVALGASVTDGTANSVLFVDSSGQLAQDNANLAYDGTTLTSTTTAGTTATVTNINSSTVTMGQITDPGAASENEAALFVTDVSGSTALHVRFPATDAPSIQIAIEQ